jgi:hypothetical protein
MEDAESFWLGKFFLLLKMLKQLLAFDEFADYVIVFGVFFHPIDFYDVWVILGFDYYLLIL